MPFMDPLAGDVGDHVYEIVDADHFMRADIDRPGPIGTGPAQRAFDTFVDEKIKSVFDRHRPKFQFRRHLAP